MQKQAINSSLSRYISESQDNLLNDSLSSGGPDFAISTIGNSKTDSTLVHQRSGFKSGRTISYRHISLQYMMTKHMLFDRYDVIACCQSSTTSSSWSLCGADIFHVPRTIPMKAKLYVSLLLPMSIYVEPYLCLPTVRRGQYFMHRIPIVIVTFINIIITFTMMIIVIIVTVIIVIYYFSGFCLH